MWQNIEIYSDLLAIFPKVNCCKLPLDATILTMSLVERLYKMK